MFIVQIAGHLGKDPEVRFTPSGQKVTSFNLATNQRKGKEDITVWVRVTVWGDRLDKIISYLKKGSAVIVIGRMNPPTTYTDKEGRTQISLEVVAEMIEFSPFGKSDRQEGQGNSYNAQNEQSYEAGLSMSSHGFNKASAYSPNGIGQGSSQTIDDDTLPF